MKKRMISVLLCLAMLTTLCLAGLVLPASAATDLIGDGDFEGTLSKQWSWTGASASYIAQYAIISDGNSPMTVVEEADGNHCLEIPELVESGGSKLYDRYFCDLNVAASKTYRLTLRYKGNGLRLYFHSTYCTAGKGAPTIADSTEWKTFTREFTTAASINKNFIIAIGHTASTGTVLVDDIQLFEVIEPTSISFVSQSVSLKQGETKALSLSAQPDGAEVPADVTYTSSNTAVATVSAAGVVTAVADGVATITATAGNLSATCTVMVEAESVITGGSFEFAAGDEIYQSNWKTPMNQGAQLVADPLGGDNQCLMLPKFETKTDIYIKNVNLEANTTYIFSFDVYAPEAAKLHLYSSAFASGGGTFTIKANAQWTAYSREFTTISDTASHTAYPNWLIGFPREANVAAIYIDNVSLVKKVTDEPEPELPSVEKVEALVTGGDFENEDALSTNWSGALKKGSVVEDTIVAGNHCLKLPMMDTPIGDVYIQNVWLEPNTTYYMTFDMRGGASVVYFNSNAFLTAGAKQLPSSDRWQTHTYRLTTKNSETYLKDGNQNFLICFSKKDTANNAADTFVDNVRVTKAGAYVDPALENGSIMLSTWKDPDTIGAQVIPTAGGTVTVTVTPDEGYMLKPGSLCYVTEKGVQMPILNKESGDFGEGRGNIFRFVQPDGVAMVTAEFVPTAEQNFRFETLGTSVYYDQGATDLTGLRFLNRLYVNGLNVNSDTMTVLYNGKQYTVSEFGSLLKRATNTATALTLENVNDAAPSSTRVWKATAYTDGVMKLVDYTESYVDFTVVMKTSVASAEFTAREYTACGYMVLTDGDNTITLYTKTMTDSAENTLKHTNYLPDKNEDWRLHPQDFKLIAFGFDDLPTSAANVRLVIDSVAKYEGSATCFVLGANLEKSGPELLEYALQNGFEIGNHSYDHQNMRELSYEEVLSQLQTTNALIESAVGVKPKWFRPPYLASNSTIQEACLACDGMYVVNGNKNSTTNAWYNVEDGGNVLRDAVNNAYDGAIYVMHPARTETALSMDEICKQLYDQGYRFCTMSQLFEYKGIEPQYSKTYHDVNG